MSTYYNEFKPEAAHMLRQLIKDGLIAPGDVDERSITEVKADDLKGYTQCHFFAGIGGWSVALRQAGWSDDRPVWTGSCPCQPFSTAGKRKGQGDERHLWPVWFSLIRECKPSIVFGEQVSSAISHGWLDGVYTDLEAEGYAIGAAVLPACSVDAPHKRDRLWFVADAESQQDRGICERYTQSDTSSSGNMGNPEYDGRYGCQITGSDEKAIQDSKAWQDCSGQSKGASEDGTISDGSVCDTILPRSERYGRSEQEHGQKGWQEPDGYSTKTGFWSDYEWLLCGDGKIRRIPSTQSGICELVDGIPNDPLQKHYESVPIVTAQKVQGRAALLHALGNAIVPDVAARFIKATM